MQAASTSSSQPELKRTYSVALGPHVVQQVDVEPDPECIRSEDLDAQRVSLVKAPRSVKEFTVHFQCPSKPPHTENLGHHAFAFMGECEELIYGVTRGAVSRTDLAKRDCGVLRFSDVDMEPGKGINAYYSVRVMVSKFSREQHCCAFLRWPTRAEDVFCVCGKEPQWDRDPDRTSICIDDLLINCVIDSVYHDADSAKQAAFPDVDLTCLHKGSHLNDLVKAATGRLRQPSESKHGTQEQAMALLERLVDADVILVMEDNLVDVLEIGLITPAEHLFLSKSNKANLKALFHAAVKAGAEPEAKKPCRRRRR